MERSAEQNEPNRARSGSAAVPLAFIYDRHATPQRALLDLRVEACREYAADAGYEVAGVWVDEGDDALQGTTRPQFDALLEELAAAAATGRRAFCLVNGWDRLAHAEGSTAFQNRIQARGGWTVTALGEDDLPRSARRGSVEDLLLSGRIARVYR